MGLKNIISSWVNDHQRKRDKENVERASDMLTDLLLELQKASGKMMAVEDKSIYNIQEEELDQYLMTASALETALQDAGTLRLHVEEIDSHINTFVSKTSNAIRMDYAEAAKYGMDGIAWGILVGRDDISADQMPKEEQIVTSRLKMLQAYGTCIEAAEDLDVSQMVFKKTMTKLVESRGRLRTVKNEIHLDEDLYEELMDEKRLYGPETSGSRPDLKAINGLLIKQNSISVEIKALCDERDILEQKINTVSSELDKAKIAMLMMSTKFNKELPEELKKLSEEVIHVIAENKENLDKLIEADASLSAAMTGYTESNTVKNANAAAYRYELDMQEQERKQKAAKLKREAEKRENTTRQNEKRQIITN